jgi:hypothetical protein
MFTPHKAGGKNYERLSQKQARHECKVTFELPKEVGAQTAQIVGDFDNWDERETPLQLEAGQEYRFRNLLDDARRENDWDANAYVPNGFGTEDSLVRT